MGKNKEQELAEFNQLTNDYENLWDAWAEGEKEAFERSNAVENFLKNKEKEDDTRK